MFVATVILMTCMGKLRDKYQNGHGRFILSLFNFERQAGPDNYICVTRNQYVR